MTTIWTAGSPPERFSEWQRRGFHDGVDGARKDYGNHRRPSVFNREEYRDPRVPPEVARDYRQGFRRGYEMAASRLWGRDVNLTCRNWVSHLCGQTTSAKVGHRASRPHE